LNRNGELQYEEDGLALFNHDSRSWLDLYSLIVNDHLIIFNWQHYYARENILTIIDPENNVLFDENLFPGGHVMIYSAQGNTQQDAVIIPTGGAQLVINSFDLEGNINWQTECQYPQENGYLSVPKHFPELGWIIVVYNGIQAALFNLNDQGELVREQPHIFDFSRYVHDVTYRDGTISVIGIEDWEQEDDWTWMIKRVDITEDEVSEPFELFPFQEGNKRYHWTIQTASNGNIWFTSKKWEDDFRSIAGLNSEGQRLTGENGIRVQTMRDREPIVKVDPEGGCWFVWTDNRIRALHLDAHGGRFGSRWSLDGEVIFNEDELELVDAVLDNETNTLYVTAKNDRSYFVQLIGEEWLSVQENVVQIPTKITLHPPAPNPFNSSTTITYGLPQASPVLLKAYNVTGRLVATLLDGNQQAGIHAATFNAGALPSGLYFIKLESAGKTLTGKVMLIR